MRLSDLGELGLLAELERRGLAQRIENDAAQLGDNLVVTQDALLEGVHFRFDLIAFYEGLNEPGVPVVGGDTSSAETVLLSVTAIGRSERVPGRGGARPGDFLVVTGPLGATGAAFRAGRLVRPPIRLSEGKELARDAHALLDISDGLAVDAGHIASRSGARCVIELERVPLADGATFEDLEFGEDYELLAAVPDPGRFAVIGRCDEGEGVEIRHHGEPVDLSGWAHFG